MFRKNPCESCGACCAHFRVSFYWGEMDDEKGGTVPAGMTEDVSPFFQAMKGTNQKHPRCVALEGGIGEQVRCKIYEMRSTSCQDFGVHWRDGVSHVNCDDLIRCNQAREDYGLSALIISVPRFEITRPDLKHEKHRQISIHPLRKQRKDSHIASGNQDY